jgi:hypothetical protein
LRRLVRWLCTFGGVGFLAAALAASCAIPGFDLVDDVVASGGTAGAGASGGGGSGTGAGGSGSCGSLRWPDPPADTGPDGQSLDIVVAVRAIDFGEGDVSMGPLIGYDLDSRCTCLGDGPSCKQPMIMNDTVHCDGPGGRDNVVANLFHAAGMFDPSFGSAGYSQDANDGAWSVLVRIQGYNGEPDDDQVSLSLFTSGGLDKDPCFVDGTMPAWDGNDAWPVDASSLEDPGAGGGGAGGGGGCGSPPPPGFSVDAPLYVDTAAYVSGSVVVASLPASGILLNDEGAFIKLTGGFVTGRLAQEGGRWQLHEGILTGRWRMTDFFQALGFMSAGGSPLCTDNPIYALFKQAVCDARDLTADVSGPTTPCDAISFAMGFEAEAAQLGWIYQGTGMPGGCPQETDPALDSCPPIR